MKTPTHAAMFRVTLDNQPTYFVQGTDKNTVNGFEGMRQGLDYFEAGYNRALGRGWNGFAAGACLNWMQLQPKVFHFGTREKLVELLGDVVTPHRINGTGVFETGFKCVDQKAAAKVYEEATEPRLVPA